ncbi:MAG TPA: zinc ribbon domain-containing protein [Egibacteraceae bacterium]|nr:zinc ribbon domain-containing protein [Egibacteraceae bacterium]
MPTYEFVCTDCGAATEVRASIRDREAGLPAPPCGVCGGAALRRLFGAVAVLGGAAAADGGGCACGGACACRGR